MFGCLLYFQVIQNVIWHLMRYFPLQYTCNIKEQKDFDLDESESLYIRANPEELEKLLLLRHIDLFKLNDHTIYNNNYN